MSLAIVREIIDVSVDFFLAERMSEELSPPIPSSFLPASISVPSFDDPTVPPSRPPPPLPPVGGQGSKIPLSRQDIAINKEKLWAAKLFKSLEEYIKVSFSSWECLNASFVDSSAAPALGINTQAEEAVQPPKDTGEVFIPVTEKPGEKEALMLTVGRAARRERANSRNGRGSKTHELRPTFRPPPCIDWDLAQLFYDVVLNAGEDALERLEILEPQSAQRRTQLKYAIEEARIDMLKVLLKTTESILKRPGRPLRRPEDIRFLLVILANPLLYPGGPRLTSSRPLLSPVESPQIPKPTIRKVSSPGKDMSMGGPGYHSGILKRLFGLLSNLPNECHHFLITWLTIMPERHFRPLAELGGSFTTYRISRHDTGKSVRSSGMRGKLPYSDDWQIKATARVMSLLDKANNNSLGRRRHMRTQAPGESSNNVLAWRNEAYRRGQIIPGSSFYNMRLDYCDLIADFDVWESKVAKFCFCQYPFFLSMGAKIQILEHDARRQMEVQARNAFITNISNRTALSQYMLLKVRRECLVEDSLKGISESVGTMDDIKKGLRVEFVGEDGIDAGGLKKEWFLMVAREVFDPNHGNPQTLTLT